MAPLEIDGIDGLRARAGSEIGVSDWRAITQEEVNAFADATGDHQWIHVDPERARETPFGGTIAHGLFTLSIGPRFTHEIYEVTGIAMALNYGYNKVRFPSALPVGAKLRMRVRVVSVDDVGGGGVQVMTEHTFEREGGDKPVCVAEMLVRYFPAAA